MRFAHLRQPWFGASARAATSAPAAGPQLAPITPSAPIAPNCPPPGHARRLLILSVSAGAGHTRAAEALVCSANASDALVATHVDVMNFVAPGFRRLYVDCYLKLAAHYPTLWGLLYRYMQQCDPDSLVQKLRRKLERFAARSLLQEIGRHRPDAIICTHFLPAEILAHHIRHHGFSVPVWVQVTDFDVHPIWVQQGMAGYFAGNPEVAFRMQALGLAPEQIQSSGIPIMPAFTNIPSRDDCARELGIEAHRTTLLLMGGGAGLGALDLVAERLLGMAADFQLIVMAGRNTALLARLRVLARRYPGRLIAQGFTENVERIMACADIAITKPGGLTSAECLALGLPMILTAPIPGQEERNADYLLEQAVALKACDSTTLEYRIRYLLEHPTELAAMRARALALGQADAAQRVVGRVTSKFCA